MKRKIYEVENIVLRALEEHPETRKDNFILYIDVLKNFVDIRHSLLYVFENHVELGIPSLESITRCRRKLQEKHPELRNAQAVEIRKDKEKEFIEYSKG